MNLRDVLEQQKQADNLWNNLPLEIRKTFNHDKYEFMNNGMSWLNKRIEEIKAKEATTISNSETIEEVKDNG